MHKNRFAADVEHAVGRISVPCVVPMTCRQRALTRAAAVDEVDALVAQRVTSLTLMMVS
jgi:hypothetical protein